MEEKPIEGEGTVVLDLNLVPKGWTTENVLHMMKTQGVMVIDSHDKPNAVKPYMLDDKKHPRRILKIVEHKDLEE